MKKFAVLLIAGTVSFIAARQVKENQEAKANWSESTDSVK
ncbi:DLW-39 family protein [Microbacterium foliorum]